MALKTQDKNSGLVYSSEFGRMCPQCNNPAPSCRCGKPRTAAPKKDGIVRLMRETKGRNGKGVTLITGLPLDEDGMKELAKSLKQKCGTGGSVKDHVIEIQGDHRETLERELRGLGYTVKRAGG